MEKRGGDRASSTVNITGLALKVFAWFTVIRAPEHTARADSIVQDAGVAHMPIRCLGAHGVPV